MDEPINWRDLEIFHAVLEQGSFSAAARALGLSQPTVSRHIEGLERGFGKELFTRTSAGLEPSELALVLSEHAAQMNDGMYAIQRVLDGKEEAPRGLVTVSLPHGMGGIPLARSLIGFHDHYPDICIDLKFGPPRTDLGRREADIDVRVGQPTEQDVIGARMGSIHFGMYAAEEYIERHGIPSKAEDVLEHILPATDEFVMAPFLKALSEFGVEPRQIPIRCSGNTMLVQVLANMGVTLGATPIGMELPNMRRILPEFRWKTQPLWITMHSALRRNTRIRIVWDWLKESLPPLLEQTRS